jgi:uncharacterized UBP type Zn finger protein
MSKVNHDENKRAEDATCDHPAATRPVLARSATCPACLDRGDDWVELWLCLSCGWVACSNSSPNQHAKAHYEETDHPVAVSLQNGPRAGWCYVHQRMLI